MLEFIPLKSNQKSVEEQRKLFTEIVLHLKDWSRSSFD